jgi:hypothetical protein
MHFARLSLWTLAIVCAVPRVIIAQDSRPGHPIELGLDAAVRRETSDLSNSTVLMLPVTQFRVGFFASKAISIEPSVAFVAASQTLKNTQNRGDVDTKGTSYDLDLGLLYHFRSDRLKSQPYIRPFIGIRGYSNSSDTDELDSSGSQTSLGAGVGWKAPLADRLGGRVELGYRHNVDNAPQFQPSNSIFLSFGLSYFTR